MFESTSADDLWPSYRISFGIGALLFTVFEALVGRQLPAPMVMVIFGVAIGALASAVMAVQEFRQQTHLSILREAMAEARSPARRP